MFKEFRKLLTHSIIYGVGNIMRNAVGFLLIPLYTRCLLPSDYGVIEILSIVSTMCGIFLGMGLSSAALRYYFEYDNEKEKKQVISTVSLASLLFVFVAMFILSLFSDKFSNLFFNTPEYAKLFKLVFVLMFLETTIEIPFAFIRAKERSVLFVGVSVGRLIVALTCTIYLVIYLKMGITGVIISNLVATAFSWLFLTAVTFHYCRFAFSLEKLRSIMQYGMPLIIVSCGMYVLNSVDRIFLNRYTDLATVGIYSLGFRFGIILRFLIIQPFMAGYGPYRFSIMKKDNARDIYARVLTYFCFVLVFSGLILAVFIKEVIALMTTPAFFSAYKIVPFILSGTICYGVFFICQIGIYLQKKTNSIAIILVCVAVLHLLLNWLLVPVFNMHGAALVNFLSYLVLVLITLKVSQRYYPIDYEYGRIVKLTVLAVLWYLICRLFVPDFSILGMAIKLLLVALFPWALQLVHFYKSGEINKLKEIKNTIFARWVYRGINNQKKAVR
ncbi:MAG: oligosaccharide flippase family protein [Candidatus Omnitrophota bacterium]